MAEAVEAAAEPAVAVGADPAGCSPLALLPELAVDRGDCCDAAGGLGVDDVLRSCGDPTPGSNLQEGVEAAVAESADDVEAADCDEVADAAGLGLEGSAGELAGCSIRKSPLDMGCGCGGGCGCGWAGGCCAAL